MLMNTLSADHHPVFVYGTLKAGQPNHHWLAEADFLGRRRLIGGHLHDLGPYPMAVLAEGSQAVLHGELYELNADGLNRLDRLEGYPADYDRSLRRLSDGRTAWVYHGRHQQVGLAPVIPHGDWGTTPVLHYGSNLDPQRLSDRCRDWDRLGEVVELTGWQWAIDKLGRDGSGKAGVQPRQGASTWGVVTHLSTSDIASLDRCEGVAGGHYTKTMISVRGRCGSEFSALTYVPGDAFRRAGLLATSDYRRNILLGLDHWPLPAAWRNSLAASLRTTA